MPSTERLALGTAQFGLPYGIANRTGQVSLNEAAQILDIARAAGLDTLDTAIGYGDSEVRLGEIGITRWRVFSKVPELPESVSDVVGWVESSVAGSLERLGVDRLHGLMLHRSRQLLGEHGDRLRAALWEVRELGLVSKIGVSAYGPDDLDVAWGDGFDLVQIPFNVFDRRLVTSTWLERLAEDDVEIHTRSAFLQGLLLMEKWPGYFDRFAAYHKAWDAFCAGEEASRLEASLGFVLAQPGIDRVVVGVDTAEQLEQILAVRDLQMASAPDTLASDDLDLIDPSRWNVS